MTKLKKSVIIVALIEIFFILNVLWFFCCYKKNVELPYNQVQIVCSKFDTDCVFSTDINNATPDELKVIKRYPIYLDIVRFSTVKKYINLLFLIFSIGIFIRIYLDKIKENREIELNYKQILLFSFIPAYKFFYIYSKNMSEMNILIPCLMYLIIFSGFYFTYYLLKKVFKTKSVFLVTFIFLVLFSNFYGIFNLDVDDQYYNLGNIVFLAIAVLLASMILLIELNKKTLDYTKYFIYFLMFSCFSMCFLNFFKTINLKNLLAYGEYKAKKVFYKQANAKRNIFIIVTDMYAGDYILKKLGYDNKNFYSELEKRDFHVFRDINSNYHKTIFSISSFLNMEYLENVHELTPLSAIQKSTLFHLAKFNDYQINYMSSFCVIKDYKNNVFNIEDYYSAYYINELFEVLFIKTPFKFLAKFLPKNDTIKEEEFIKKIVSKKQKNFTFLHVVAPHHPYLFDADGNELKEVNPIMQKDCSILRTDSYLKYVGYTNKHLLNLIDIILKSQNEKPIIILTGDHGCRYMNCNDIEHDYERVKDVTPWNIKSQFNTFLAYYNPDIDINEYKNTVSLINFFRQFSNDVFKTDFEYLKNKYVYYNSFETVWGNFNPSTFRIVEF